MVIQDKSISQHDPVTVIVKHRVIPGKEKEYENWAQGITDAARQFDGYLGVNYIRPSDIKKGEYVIIFRFNSYENMQRWEDSPERTHWRNKRRHLTFDEPEIQRFKGWDYWFTLPADANTRPPRYKMLVVTCISIYPLALFIPMLLKPLISWMPPYLEVLITAAIIVPLMIYVLMPLMVKIFSGWLYNTKNQTR